MRACSTTIVYRDGVLTETAVQHLQRRLPVEKQSVHGWARHPGSALLRGSGVAPAQQPSAAPGSAPGTAEQWQGTERPAAGTPVQELQSALKEAWG